jgi:hypothetical protein
MSDSTQRTEDPPFRERARMHLVEAFGEPEVLQTSNGPLYRWVLRRKHGVDAHVYVTLDSPEMPDIAHVLVSDPAARTIEKITSRTMRTMEEVDALIKTIRNELTG